jgi:hypothetical protein
MMREENGEVVPIVGFDIEGAVRYRGYQEPVTETYPPLAENNVAVLLLTAPADPDHEQGVRTGSSTFALCCRSSTTRVVALAPAESEELEELILSLRGASLLTGVRGRAPVDVASVARAAAALSHPAANHPEIAEIEVNLLLATPGGAIGLDARVVLTEP